jgi:hypothetical protein
VIQVWVTRACNLSCFACTQGSNLGGKPGFITPDQFRTALRSLKGYWGVVGVFGGNPAMHPQFEELCGILREEIPFEQRGLWCNDLINESKAKAARATFNPAVSNLNVHMVRSAWDLFRQHWPESHPFGLDADSRHSPVHLAMKDVIPDESERWRLISGCDLNRHWSAMIGVFRGQLRAWFCEVAGAQAMLHQDEPDYPDTGVDPSGTWCVNLDGKPLPAPLRWWELPMGYFAPQVRKHCMECAVPLRGYGQLSQGNRPDGIEEMEQTSATHANIFKPKRPGRKVEMVTSIGQLAPGRIGNVVDYVGNGKR